MLHSIRNLAVFLLLGAIIIPAGFLSAQSSSGFEWREQIDAGKAVEIKGVNGGIKAERAEGTMVEVRAVKRGGRSDPADVDIQVVKHGNGVTICTVYPSSDFDRPNECTPGEGGRMNVRNNDTKVEFTVRVPAGVRFIGRTVNGGITVRELQDDIEAYTVNGGIDVSGSGTALAQTVNGGIRASLGSGSLGKSMSFKTVNGGIDVAMPQGTSAEVEIQTVNGTIETEFPMTIRGSVSPKHLRGKIGNGGPGLRLETVNGGIYLRRSSS